MVSKIENLSLEKEKNFIVQNLLQEERRRIAEALHSGAGQALSHALFLLNLYDKTKQTQGLDDVRQAIKTAINEIRSAIHELRNDPPWPLLPSIRDSIAEFKERTGITVQFVFQGTDEDLPPKVSRYILSFLQEGLHNVLKHANTTNCEFFLNITHDFIVATLKDNGIGIPPGKEKEGVLHFGLKFLKERAEEMKGELSIQFEKGEGTTLKAVIPLPLKS
jgi:signal transduction histidine kinase